MDVTMRSAFWYAYCRIHDAGAMSVDQPSDTAISRAQLHQLRARRWRDKRLADDQLDAPHHDHNLDRATTLVMATWMGVNVQLAAVLSTLARLPNTAAPGDEQRQRRVVIRSR